MLFSFFSFAIFLDCAKRIFPDSGVPFPSWKTFSPGVGFRPPAGRDEGPSPHHRRKTRDPIVLGIRRLRLNRSLLCDCRPAQGNRSDLMRSSMRSEISIGRRVLRQDRSGSSAKTKRLPPMLKCAIELETEK